MFRTLAAIALSGALALTPLTAGPAQALDERDLLGILAGVAALAIIWTGFHLYCRVCDGGKRH